MFFLESIFSDLFSVDNFISDIFLCVLDMFWDEKQPNYVGVVGIRHDKSGRYNVFTPGDDFGRDFVVHDNRMLEGDAIATFSHDHGSDFFLVADLFVSDTGSGDEIFI